MTIIHDNFYFYTLYFFIDINSCTLIMKDGRYHGKKEWQPYGCMMHNYTQIDTKKCFKLHHFFGQYNHFTFVGDSRIFQFYSAFLKTINSNFIFKHNGTQSYSDPHLGLQIEYKYNPFLLVPFGMNVTKWKSKNNYPSVLMLGFGINQLLKTRNAFDKLQQFKNNLTNLVPIFNELVFKNVKVIWTLQEPVKFSNMALKNQIINNSIIDLYNNAAVEVSI